MSKITLIFTVFVLFASGVSCFSISESLESVEDFLIDDDTGEHIILERSPRMKKNSSTAKVVRVDAEQARKIVADETKSANRFIDFALGAVSKVLKGKGDEISLPERKREISKKVWGFPFRAFANFYDGKISGLQSIQRTGDAMLVETENKESIAQLAFFVELHDIEVKYAYSISLMNIGPVGHVTGNLKSIKIHLKLKIAQSGTIVVDNFDVKDTGIFTVHTSGLGPFNFILSGVGLVIGNLSKRFLFESLEEKLKQSMNSALANITSNSQKRGFAIMMKAMLMETHKTQEVTTATTPSQSEETDQSQSNKKMESEAENSDESKSKDSKEADIESVTIEFDLTEPKNSNSKLEDEPEP